MKMLTLVVLVFCCGKIVKCAEAIFHIHSFHQVNHIEKKEREFHLLDQFRYINIQPKTIDLSTRLWGITTECVALFLRASY